MRAAVISSGVVENVILVESLSFDPGAGLTLVGIPDASPVGAGWSYANGVFSAPAPAPRQQMSQADFIAALGPANMARIVVAMNANPPTPLSEAVAMYFTQGLTTNPITYDPGYADTLAIETAGVLPAGTAAAIWNG